ncbi:hypothetical protein BJ508DRAFT_418171 [Ascobolus immersus RN42]|uniref:F-box domain-containing protein n=1 Tax=Ascobolus immersus RN42 TaxID=1160509 RepID=A0A3N4HNS2_ASCIM|nr:hypothetical protein BJ508DRAFT_418171 [Ascobolus immersus RN42]
MVRTRSMSMGRSQDGRISLESLPYDVVLLIFEHTRSLRDLNALIRTSRKFHQTFTACSDLSCRYVVLNQFHPCVLDVLDIKRPLGIDRSATSFMSYFMDRLVDQDDGNELPQSARQKDKLADLKLEVSTRFSSQLGHVGVEEAKWLLKWDRKIRRIVDRLATKLAEEAGRFELEEYMHSEEKAAWLSMFLMSTQDVDDEMGLFVSLYSISETEKDRIRTGIWMMLAAMRHMHSKDKLLGHEALAGTAEDAFITRLFFLDANFLFNMSLEDHITFVGTAQLLNHHHFPTLLARLLDCDSNGGLIWAHLVKRFDFTKGLWKSEVDNLWHVVDNRFALTEEMQKDIDRRARCRRILTKGILGFCDQFGVFDVFQPQIEKLKKLHKHYETECGYMEDHFMEVDIGLMEQGCTKKILVLGNEFGPKMIEEDSEDPIPYLHVMKERLYVVNDSDGPNDLFMNGGIYS